MTKRFTINYYAITVDDSLNETRPFNYTALAAHRKYHPKGGDRDLVLISSDPCNDLE